jgi:hypothetical protein
MHLKEARDKNKIPHLISAHRAEALAKAGVHPWLKNRFCQTNPNLKNRNHF